LIDLPAGSLLAGCVLVIAAGLMACAPASDRSGADGEVRDELAERWEIDSPAAPVSFAPNLVVAEGVPILSWLEETGDSSAAPGHRLLVSRFELGEWSVPVTVAEGSDLFANWADIPAVAVASDGTTYAHWLAKTAADTYAYSIYLARSEDGGASWFPMGTLNDDATETEHGFVSFVTQDDGVRAFWLDGRQIAEGGPMNVRTAMVNREVGISEVLDDRVCECCATDAAMTSEGPVVVMRDRSREEVRDIGIVRQQGDAWTATERIAVDGWRIEGCPVNGPAVAAAGMRVGVAWYTAAGGGPKVLITISEDAGGSFGPPRVIDGGRPLGRVDLVEDGSGGFLATWLEGADQLAEIRLGRFGNNGEAREPIVVARTSPSRASGFPRLARVGGELYLAWVDIRGKGASQVRILEIPISRLN
jgi:hypothetical protein